MNTVLAFHRAAAFPRLRLVLPLVESAVCAGFPSPADDYIEREIDLNELLVKNPPATFIVRARGHSMVGADIHDGDLLVVDKSIDARNGHIVIACLNGEFTVKRLRRINGRVWLEPANTAFPLIEIDPEFDFTIWGVVRSKVTQFKV